MRKYDSTRDDICNNLEWLMPKYKLMYESLVLAYKITFSKTNVLQNYLDFSFSVSHATRSQSYKIPTIICNTKYGKKMFKFSAVQLWLQLPDHIVKNLTNVKNFKTKLMSHFLQIQKDDMLIDNHSNAYELTCINDVIEYVCNSFK